MNKIKILNSKNLKSYLKMDSPTIHLQSQTEQKLIPINRIIFTKALIDAIKSRGGKVPKVLMSKEFTTPLNRMDTVLNLISEGVVLPPIVVRKIGATEYYELIDGRHRVAASVLLGKAEVPATIVK